MDKNKNSIKNENGTQRKKKNSFLTTFVCIFLAIALLFGGVVGVMIAVRDSRAAVKYDSVMADDGTVIYLASRYKTLFLSTLTSMGISASDSDIFFERMSDEGITYGELYERGLKEYISSIIIANYLFQSYTSYTTEDKMIVAASIEEVLKYKADGSIAVFNSLTEKYGFDYHDFEAGTELLYKAETAQRVIYGEGGSNLVSFPNECNEFLKKYNRVSLLFIRDTTKLVTEENGDIKEVELTEEEKATRLQATKTLSDAIKARKEGSDADWITPEMFEKYLETSDGDKNMHAKGYYFRGGAEKTAEFAEEFPEIVEASLALEMGEYAEVKCSIGTCFIYRYETKDGAYADADNVFFSDFYADAADYLYSESLTQLASLVEFREAYGMIDTLSVPKNYEFYVKSWKR